MIGKHNHPVAKLAQAVAVDNDTELDKLLDRCLADTSYGFTCG